MTMLTRHAGWAATLAGLGVCAVRVGFAQPALSSSPCRVPGLDEQVRCATLEVPENRAITGGRTIPLRIVILPSRAPANAPRQALFYLVGGPGLAATPLADLVAASHSTTRATHDIVLVDQRGTGASNALRCEFYGTAGDVGAYLGDQFPSDSVRACALRLSRRADLTQYTTANAAADLEAVRSALGFSSIDLDASAYGTQVALDYLGRHADRLRTVVLQGAMPLGASLPRSAAGDAQAALERVMLDCAADPFCRGSFPRLRSELNALLERFDRGPMSLRVEHPRSRDSITVRLTRGVFADRLRLMLYSTRLSRRIPIVVHAAHGGDWTPFVRVAYELSRVVFDQLDVGAHLSVACVDSRLPRDAMEARPPGHGHATFLGDYRLRMYQEACAVWPHARPPGVEPVATRPLSVLVISGALDPVTPPRLAAAVASAVPNATVITVPGMAHAGAEKCVEAIVVEFIRRGGLTGVDTQCVNAIKPPPFITR